MALSVYYLHFRSLIGLNLEIRNLEIRNLKMSMDTHGHPQLGHPQLGLRQLGHFLDIRNLDPIGVYRAQNAANKNIDVLVFLCFLIES